MLLIPINDRHVVPIHPNIVHRNPIELTFPSDTYTVMIILISITISLSAISESFYVFHIHCWFRCDVSFESHRDFPFWFRLVRRMECGGLIVYRLTMAFVQSPRPILVMSAECICGLLIYILVILIVVAIWHLTLEIRLFAFNQFRSETKTIFAEEDQRKSFTLPIGNS